MALEGSSREAAARAAGPRAADAARRGADGASALPMLDRQTLRDWVHRYNAEGVAGLVDRPRPGRPPRLSGAELDELIEIVEAGPDVETDGVVRWRCADLAGVVAAHTTLPVVGVPIASGALNGVDALYSTVQMPPGIPVATVAIDGARNAALLVVEMLAISDQDLAQQLADYRLEIAGG